MAQHILHLQFKIFRMKNIIVIILTTFFGSFINAQVIPIGFIKPQVNDFSSVVIGTQRWMSKNLEVVTYRNGDPIPQVTDPTAWVGLKTGAWCYYNNDPANGAIYGKLYNWYAVDDSRGLAPQGWHIPTDAEWTLLGNTLGGITVAGGKMKTTTSWNAPNTGATNESGYAGLPAGYRTFNNGAFIDLGNVASWWSSTSYNSSNAWSRYPQNTDSNLGRSNDNKKYGFSVRLIKD